MNLALGAVLLAILLIPPVIIYLFFSVGAYAKSAPKLSLLEYLLGSAFFCLIIHTTIIYIFNLPVDFSFLISFISGQDDLTTIYSNEVIKHYLFGFAEYIVVVCFFAAILGGLLGLLATSRKLRMKAWLQKSRDDKKPSKIFSYYSNWWYYFRANEYNREYKSLGYKEPYVYVDVLIDIKDTSILYSGILVDFVTNGEELDRICLERVSKRTFVHKTVEGNIELEEGKEIAIMPKGYLTLSYSKVSNIAIRFVSSEPQIQEDEAVNIDYLRTAKPKAQSGNDSKNAADNQPFL